jgi:hypothetical protein
MVERAWGMWSESGGRSDKACVSSVQILFEPESELIGQRGGLTDEEQDGGRVRTLLLPFLRTPRRSTLSVTPPIPPGISPATSYAPRQPFFPLDRR